jgi:hypothetical protein
MMRFITYAVITQHAMIGVAAVAQQGDEIGVENCTTTLSSSYYKAFAVAFINQHLAPQVFTRSITPVVDT